MNASSLYNLTSVLLDEPTILPPDNQTYDELRVIAELLRVGSGAAATKLNRNHFKNQDLGLVFAICLKLEQMKKPHNKETVGKVMNNRLLSGKPNDGMLQRSEYFKHEPEGSYEGFNPEGLKDEAIDITQFLDDIAREQFDGFDMIEDVAERMRKESPVPQPTQRTEDDKKSWYLDTVLASEIEPEDVEWLWENRIPKGSLSAFCGDADKGKGVTGTDLVARLTTGRPMPNGSPNPFNGQPVSVLVMGAEDALKTVVVPRLMAAGADLTKVHILKSMSREGEKSVVKRQLALDTDLASLKLKLTNNPEIRFSLIDPISNYVGEADLNREKDMRRVLTPVRDLAEELNTTIIIVAHFNKNTGANAIHRVGGAQALTSIPRSSWCFMNDPEVPDQYMMLPIKKNVGKKAKGLTFRIAETFINIGKPKLSSQPKIVWGGETDKGANEVMSQENDPELRGLGKATQFLTEYLADGEAHISADVYRASEALGISEKTIKRAMRQLNVESFRKGNPRVGQAWYMRLSEPDQQN